MDKSDLFRMVMIYHCRKEQEVTYYAKGHVYCPICNECVSYELKHSPRKIASILRNLKKEGFDDAAKVIGDSAADKISGEPLNKATMELLFTTFILDLCSMIPKYSNGEFEFLIGSYHHQNVIDFLKHYSRMIVHRKIDLMDEFETNFIKVIVRFKHI